MHQITALTLVIIGGVVLQPAQAPALAAIIYVDDSATGANSGVSWDDAFTNLHDALKIAQAGEEIRIGQGTYKPAAPGSGDRDAAFFLVDGVLMQGGFAGAGASNPDEYDPEQYPTILSGDIEGNDGPNFTNYGENSYNVIVADGVGPHTVVKGLTIRGGFANLYELGWTNRRSFGGGLSGINGSQPTLIECVVRDNRSIFGGGSGIRTQGITLHHCQFVNNTGQVGTQAPGGAVYLGSLNSTIEDCLFQSNFSDNVGGGIAGVNYTPILIRRCTFVDNASNEASGAIARGQFTVLDSDFIGNVGWHGGGAAIVANSTFINCRFISNIASQIFAAGSAIGSEGSVNVINCLFAGNEGSRGTFVANPQYSAPDSIIGCTFVGNTSNQWAGSAITVGPQSVVANTIAWDNYYQSGSTPPASKQFSQINASQGTILANNMIQGWDGTLGGTNNSGANPLFIDADGLDNEYGTEDDNPRLSDASPARDAGANTFLPQDQFDLDEDGNTTEVLPLDLDGLRRIVNGTADIGAYEWQRLAGCEADIAPSSPGVAGDGTINVQDLLLMLQHWGSCDQCVGDINGDGVVNVADMLAIINAWGTCP